MLRYGADVPVSHPLRRQRSLGVVPFYGRLEVRWLFGLGVTCGTELASFADPVGPGTDAALDEIADAASSSRPGATTPRCSRPSSGTAPGSSAAVSSASPAASLQCIGHTEDGCPASPSQFLVNHQKLQPFTVEHFTYPPGLRGNPARSGRPRPIA